MRKNSLRLFVVAVAIGFPLSWSGAAPPAAKRNVAPEIALAKPAKLDIDDVPIGDVADRLYEQFAVPVYVDNRSLNNAGISLEKKMSLAGKYKSLENGLTELLKPQGMSWRLQDDVLVLTTAESADASLYTRVYLWARPAAVFDQLIESVTKIQPTTWDAVGGSGSICELRPDLLVVRQTWQIHGQIRAQFEGTLRSLPHAVVKESPQVAQLGSTRALAQPATCAFQKTPLEEALATLSHDCKVTLTLDKEALEKASVSSTAPVSCSLRGVRLGTVLSLLLGQLNLAIVPEKAGLRITTQENANLEWSTISYPASDLIFKKDTDSLVDVIMATNKPTSWAIVGGKGKIQFQPKPGTLEVNQTFDVHRQIQQLLADIRAAHAGSPRFRKGK